MFDPRGYTDGPDHGYENDLDGGPYQCEGCENDHGDPCHFEGYVNGNVEKKQTD